MSDIVKRVNAVMNDVGAISKDRENAHFKYNYVSAEAVRAKVQKACVKHGLILRLTYEREEVSATASIMKCLCAVSMDGATFVHLGEGWGAGQDRGDKSPMKSCTAAAKYALANAFCIALGDDPEADAETDNAGRMSEKLSTPGYAFGAEETARAARQADEKSMAKAEADGLINSFTCLTSGDDASAWIRENAAAWDVSEKTQRNRVYRACLAHVKKGLVDGMTEAGFAEELEFEVKKQRKEVA